MDFACEVCSRLPLAEATLRLLDFATHDDFLTTLYADARGRSYQKVISFPLFVHLIAEALLQHDGSGHQSFQRAKEQNTLPASIRAMYGKLARVPLGLSQAFLVQTSHRLQQVLPTPRAPVPPSLQRFTLMVLDGKKIKQVAKRLKATQPLRGHLFGGKLVAALALNSGLAVAFAAHPDGEASDVPLLPAVLAQVRAHVPGPRLYILDRLFCDLNQPQRLCDDGDHFLLRYNAKVPFHPDRSRPPRDGVDSQGRPYREEWGWLGQPSDPRRRYVRRIRLPRAGDTDLILVTDLLDADAYPAADLLDAYWGRWGIERVFQRVTEVFHLQPLIGCTPQATVFQAAFCFLLYNLIMVVRAYVAEAQEREPETISSENLFTDVQRELVAWNEVLSPAQTLVLLSGRSTAKQLHRRLRQLLRQVWTERWQKAAPKQPSGKPARPKKRTRYLKGGHSSVYRILQAARQKQGKPPLKC